MPNMNRRFRVLVALSLCLIGSMAFGQENAVSKGLALTPPMGFNTWNKFACNVSDELVRGMADAMVKSGMKDAGYQYIVIDDCWQVSRDANANIVADPQRFPNGIKALADYVHSLGLRFGIYSDAGTKTCAGRPAGLGHEYQDALMYASWGVDYLKYDWCNTLPGQDAKSSYANIRQALDASGRPIVLSICEWGGRQPWLWGKQSGGNLWRTTGDIQDRWAGKKEWSPGNCCSNGILDIVDENAELYTFAAPGTWNDPDLLEAGNGLRSMTPEIRDILTNKEVTAIDQDPLGRQGRRVWKDGDREVWAKQLKDGDRAVILLNRGSSERDIAVNWE